MTSDKQNSTDSSLLRGVRSRRNLWRAWFHVYPRAAASGNLDTRKAAASFRQDAPGNIEAIQRKLAAGSFKFLPQRGFAKKRGSKSRRPIVAAPLENRIVQRAILQTLQVPPKGCKTRLAGISEVLETPTSVGGLPNKGVPNAVELISLAIKSGATHFFRSDIKGFFTAVSKPDVIDILYNEIGDPGFVELFSNGLSVELENEDELRKWIDLFPIGDVGVPQGSALSTFSGNLLLRTFDRDLNDETLTTVRYIDDFVVLARSGKAASKAARKCKEILNGLALDIYDPSDGTDKAELGEVSEGFDFLSYRFRRNEISTTKDAKKKLLRRIEDEISAAKLEIRNSLDDPRRTEARYIQVLYAIDQCIRGWSDSFRYVNRRLEFQQLDKQISQRLAKFEHWFIAHCRDLNCEQKRRALGVALLSDTPRENAAES